MRKEITVKTTSVYELRSLAELVGIANGYSAKIELTMDNRHINAKSIMGITGLGLDVNKVITIEAEGADAEAAICAIEEFLSM